MATVRWAVAGDADGIARAHLASFRAAYAHFLPAERLAEMDVDSNAARKLALIEEGKRVLVAEEAGKIVGFTIVGANRYPEVPCDGELQAIYVHPDCQRSGVGRALLRASAQALRDQGFESAVVFAFADNPAGRAFYLGNGAEFHSAGSFNWHGVDYPDESFVWKSVAELCERLSPGA